MSRRTAASPAFFLILLAGSIPAFAQTSEADQRQRILAAAARYKGVPYMYGAESPAAFDCSGFVRYVYREAAGVVLPRSSRGIYAAGVPIAPDAAKPGDVFVYDTVGGSPSHVAIYLGDGSVIHAVSEGPRTGVIVSSASDSYFPPRLIAARSFLGGGNDADSGKPSRDPAAASPAPKPPTGKSSTVSTPKPAPAAPVAAPAVEETPVADIGFSIPARRESYTDRIPAAAGTKIAFTLTNDTGTDGSFIVLFYKTNSSFGESREIHRERARIASGASLELPAYLFSEPGVYKLIVKDTWNTQLLERIFTVSSK